MLFAAGCSKPAHESNAATDFNGSWGGPTPEFTQEDSIPLPAITRNAGWLPFSQGLPEDRKAPSREDQLKARAAWLANFRKVVASGGNVFAKGGAATRGRSISIPFTEAGEKALAEAEKEAISNRIPANDENSLLHCYPANFYGLGDPVLIVQGPKAMVFYSTNRTRVIYLDGRSFDSAPISDYGGYSIGHWEGNTLVIQTKDFRAPTLGLGFGAPSVPLGEKAMLTEYITKIEDGKTLQIKTVFEDPDYLKEKIGKMEYLSWQPDQTPVNENCIEGFVSQVDYDQSKFKPQ